MGYSGKVMGNSTFKAINIEGKIIRLTIINRKMANFFSKFLFSSALQIEFTHFSKVLKNAKHTKTKKTVLPMPILDTFLINISM